MIRKLEVIVYFRKVFLLSKFKYFCFVAILDMSLISRSCKNDHIVFNGGTPSLEDRNIRLVNMKIRGDEPFFGLKSLCKNVWNTWNWWRVTQNLTMNDIWRHIFWNEFRFLNNICNYIVRTEHLSAYPEIEGTFLINIHHI
jgi:hypothetical protein